MKIGKISESVLKRSVFKQIKHRRDEVLVSPGVGKDCALIELAPDEVMVLSTDPITGTANQIGKLAVNITANDIAASGAEMIGIMLTILLPERLREIKLREMMQEIEENCKAFNIEVIGGHTEVCAAVSQPIITVTGVGKIKKDEITTTAGLKPGHELVMTKWAGLEGTAILANDKEEELLTRYNRDFIAGAKDMIQYTIAASIKCFAHNRRRDTCSQRRRAFFFVTDSPCLCGLLRTKSGSLHNTRHITMHFSTEGRGFSIVAHRYLRTALVVKNMTVGNLANPRLIIAAHPCRRCNRRTDAVISNFRPALLCGYRKRLHHTGVTLTCLSATIRQRGVSFWCNERIAIALRCNPIRNWCRLNYGNASLIASGSAAVEVECSACLCLVDATMRIARFHRVAGVGTDAIANRLKQILIVVAG